MSHPLAAGHATAPLRLSAIVLACAAAFALMAATPAAHAQAAAALSAQHAFSIPAQPLGQTINALARASGVAISVDAALVAGRNAAAVQGTMTLDVALQQALADTGLAAVSNGAAVVIRRAETGRTSTLPPVSVTADLQEGPADSAGYVARRSESATKSDTPLIKTPQAISVVTRDQMDVQNVQSVAQALRYTSGVMPEQRGTNTDSLEYLYARGFQVEEYLNGLRLPGSIAGYNITSFDPYMLERVELLHGPASVLYGQGSPGGMVNLVGKMPTAEALHEIGVQTGSYGRAQAYGDFSGALNKDGTLLYRITADGFDAGTQIDHVRQERFSIAPSLTWRPDQDTSLTLFASYQTDPKAGVYNFVPAVGTALPGAIRIPRGLDVGDPDFDSFRKTQSSVGYSFSHRFNDVWSVKQNYRFLHNSQTVQYVSYDAMSADQTQILRTPYLNSGTVNMHTLDNQAIARFSTGPLAHKATLGLDYQSLRYDHIFYGSLDDTPPLDIANPQYGQAIPYPDFEFATSSAQTLKQLGLYAQDQIDIDKWSFLLGLRQDWVNEDTTAYKSGAATEQFNRAFTWRLGGVYQFDNGVAPYASYSTSFQPQLGTDYSGKVFVPTRGKQYEVGVKYQPKGYNSFVTVAAFHLEQSNVSTTDPDHAGFSVQTGQVRSRGIEVEGHASLARNLQLIASYTYTDLRNTESNTASLGKVPVGIPRNMASLWADYTLPGGPLAGLQLGGGVRYIGSSYGDTANTFSVPSATLVDLAVRYDLGRSFAGMRGWTASLNASNLFNRDYLSWCSSDTCNWGMGRLFLAGLKYQW